MGENELNVPYVINFKMEDHRWSKVTAVVPSWDDARWTAAEILNKVEGVREVHIYDVWTSTAKVVYPEYANGVRVPLTAEDIR